MTGRVRELAQMNAGVSVGLQSLAILAGKLETEFSVRMKRNVTGNRLPKTPSVADSYVPVIRASTPAKAEPRVSPAMLETLRARAQAPRPRAPASQVPTLPR